MSLPTTTDVAAPNVQTGRDGPRHGASWTRRDWIWVAALLAAAALLRLPTLGRWSLWIDEAYTVHDAALMASGADSGHWTWAFHKYPVNYWLVGRAMAMWGTSEFSLRILPCLAGLASIGLLYAGVRRHAGTACATVAAGLMTLSSWHIYWSQNARHYAPMLMFTIIAAFAGFEALKRPRPAAAVVAIAAFALATLSHPSAAAVGAALGVFALWRYYRHFTLLTPSRRLAVVVVLAVLLALLAVRFWPIVRVALSVKQGSGFFFFIKACLRHLEPPLIVAAAAGTIVAWRTDRQWGAFLTTYAAVPVAAFAAGGLVMHYGSLYVFSVLPAVCALAAQAIVGVGRVPLGSPFAAAVLGAVVVGHQLGETVLYFTYRNGDRPRWREAAQYLTDAGADRGEIVTTSGPVMAYYLGYEPLTLRRHEPIIEFRPSTAERIMARDMPQWLALKTDRLVTLDADGTFQAWLARHATCLAEFPASSQTRDVGIRIYRSHPRPLQPGPVP